MTRATDDTECSARVLDWDTRHFGWPVARLDATQMTDALLRVALEAARERGIRLVYWHAEPGVRPSPELLTEFSGELVDRRVTFRCQCAGADAPEREAGADAWSWREWPVVEPTAELVELAVTAGVHSRFARDRRIPADRFRALYEAWIRNSTLRQNADMVLTASDANGALAGLVTVAFDRSNESTLDASIGLVAVATHARRRGLGHLLLRAACSAARCAGGPSRAVTMEVVTQEDNVPAMALYTGAGFAPVERRHGYHFWLNEERTGLDEGAHGTGDRVARGEGGHERS